MTKEQQQADDLQVLCSMPVFGGIDDLALRFLLDRADEVERAQGTMFFREGDDGASMYVLRSGRVAIIRTSQGRDYSLMELGPGDCFGEMALIDRYPRSASVLALQDCTALELSTATLLQLYGHDMKQFTLIQMNMGREVSRRLRGVAERLFQRQIADGDPPENLEGIGSA